MSQSSSRKLSPYPGPTAGMLSDGADHRPWEIVLCGDLTDRQSDLISKLVETPVGSRGLIYFDSCGGSVYTGLALATIIKSRELRATAVVAGECSSAALLPFAACQRRLVTAFSTLLFHPIRWQSEEDVKLEEATEWARHFKQLETDLDALLCQLLPMASETLSAWSRPGRFVTGKELAESGLAELFDPFSDVHPWKTVNRS